MAEIIIKCPHCGASMSLEEEYLGMEFQCPVCNQQFIAERADDDSYNIMNDEKETGREADGVSTEQEIGLTPQTQSPAENTAGEQDLPTESVAPETWGDGDGSAESAKDKLGNLFSGAKGKLGNLYANAKEKLTDDRAQALAANAKDKLGTLFTNAKGKLGDLYAAAKEKMDEASSVEGNTDPVNAGEPEEVVRKEYDEDNLPEPDPGFYDEVFERPAIVDKLTKALFVKIAVVLAVVMYTIFTIKTIYGTITYTRNHNGNIYREIKGKAHSVIADTEKIEEEAKRIYDASIKEQIGKIQVWNYKIKECAQQIENESARFFSNDREIKLAAELLYGEADKIAGEIWNERRWRYKNINELLGEIKDAANEINAKIKGIESPIDLIISKLVKGLLAGIGIFIILAILFVVIKITLRRKVIRHWKRNLIREYFSANISVEVGLNIFEKLLNFVEDYIPFANIIPLIIKGIANGHKVKYCRIGEPIYDEVRDLDMEYLEKLNVLARFGKNKQQLVAPMQTLFSPAFAGVEDLRHFQSVTSENDGVYRYNLEEVTKIYTFEDQLFIYTGVWAYAIGKMISEKTEAFFFKDITDMRTESTFKIQKKYEPKGCLSILIPWLGKPIETVYKESESFVLTAASGNSIGLNIGFEDAVRVTGATYTSRNDNEKIVHAIRKMIEEKKVAADA